MPSLWLAIQAAACLESPLPSASDSVWLHVQPQAPAAAPSSPAPVAPARAGLSDSERGSAVQLLDRIQAVLDKAVDGKGDQVSLDRGLLDEIRAEVTQVRMTMQGAKQ